MDFRIGDFIHKIVLGSAQLGMRYGITNRRGMPTIEDSQKVLQTAWNKGIRYFDTAPSYKSESLIGEFIVSRGIQNDIHVLTKIPKLPSLSKWKDFITLSISNSLTSLRCSQIEVLFFHSSSDSLLLLDEPEYFIDLQAEFPIKSFGVSVYDAIDIERLNNCKLDLAFQFPFNLLDRRFENNTIPAGKRFARSIFLQGLLTPRPLIETAPDELKRLQSRMIEDCQDKNISLIQQALKFAIESSCLDFILIGVESSEQLRQLADLDLRPGIETSLIEKWRSLIPQGLLDPRTWN